MIVLQVISQIFVLAFFIIIAVISTDGIVRGNENEQQTIDNLDSFGDELVTAFKLLKECIEKHFDKLAKQKEWWRHYNYNAMLLFTMISHYVIEKYLANINVYHSFKDFNVRRI